MLSTDRVTEKNDAIDVLVIDRVTSAGGLGLRQMRERIEARGGIFEIITSEGCGTKVLAALPE